MQKTLKKSISLGGIGLHSGQPVSLVVKPAAPGHGIVFKRIDQGDIPEKNRYILAQWDHVVDTRLCTVIANDHGMSVATIEHLMAALRGLWIDNVLIEIDGSEVPIMDGSSQVFIDAFEKAGIQTQSQPRRALRILKPVTVTQGDKTASLKPSAIPTYVARIQYDNIFIGEQSHEFKLLNGNFKHDLADCRTFCLLKDVEAMQAQGLALGGSLDNAVVVGEQGVINEEGLHCHNEFVRHKILDAIGDLALAGGLVLGAYEGVRAGHAMNNTLLHAVFADKTAYEWIDLYVDLDEQDEGIYGASSSVAASC